MEGARRMKRNKNHHTNSSCACSARLCQQRTCRSRRNSMINQLPKRRHKWQVAFYQVLRINLKTMHIAIARWYPGLISESQGISSAQAISFGYTYSLTLSFIFWARRLRFTTFLCVEDLTLDPITKTCELYDVFVWVTLSNFAALVPTRAR